jgi:hypothetical protein
MCHTKPQTQEAQRPPNRINIKKEFIHRHIIFKLQKIKDKEKYLVMESA